MCHDRSDNPVTTMSSLILSILAVIAYLASTVIIGLRLFRGAAGDRPARSLGILLAALAVLLHTALLAHNAITESGLDLGFFNATSLVAWTIATLILLSAITKPVENLGIVLFPLAALAIVLELKFTSSHLLLRSAPLELKIHVLVSIVAYSLLSLASVQAVLLAIQDQHLHNRQPGGFVRALPPLQTMESLLFEMIGAGFALLTLSLLTGLMFLEDMFAQHLVHKTILSMASWVVFGVLLWGRFRFGWRGRTAIAWTLTGVLVLMLAYFGSKAVLELILERPPV